MTDSDLRQLRQNLMAQFQEMMDEDVLDIPESRGDLDTRAWATRA